MDLSISSEHLRIASTSQRLSISQHLGILDLRISSQHLSIAPTSRRLSISQHLGILDLRFLLVSQYS